MAQNYPIEIGREVDRRWQRRSKGQGKSHCCPACAWPAPIAPLTSEYRGGGLIHHYWNCRACDDTWITVVRVPT